MDSNNQENFLGNIQSTLRSSEWLFAIIGGIIIIIGIIGVIILLCICRQENSETGPTSRSTPRRSQKYANTQDIEIGERDIYIHDED
ncbi:unnamed protein product [Adineta steineri]|uniref:Uncharacterized protein n=1 Tax=Adineta steineri TaxID=433720 RepID=A0A815V0G3_9BILA|nr:unnamed protein product [Adineta steineri]CAF1523491.1 unnamed protein product [Adineta steineri]CAF1651049.1 unnamed protein product [Adineta steineri]CAF1651060.1 unnamed protein product [Adineta steineri]